MVPEEGGTASGALLINECIRRKTEAAGQAPSGGTVRGALAPSPNTPIAESATPAYGKGYAVTGTASAKPRAIRQVRRGMATLPSGYPLMPGDEALWASLTPAQQQRAREFLEDGSTIRSSLEPD